jgi:putative ABC transport system ATP-binding protein
MPLLALNKICRTYNAQSDSPLRVLRDIELSVESGDFISIMGPSGSGKSTLLNILGLLDMPDGGSYIFDGREITTTPRNLLPGIRSLEIGFVFQTFNLLPRLSVYQNVMLPMVYAGKPPGERKKRVEEVLEMVQISHRRQHHPNKLSGGEQQRAAIARAMVNNPKLILADEPTGNLDSENGLRIMRELSRLNEEGHTIILITHDPDISAFARTHYRMKDGILSGESHVA